MTEKNYSQFLQPGVYPIEAAAKKLNMKSNTLRRQILRGTCPYEHIRFGSANRSLILIKIPEEILKTLDSVTHT